MKFIAARGKRFIVIDYSLNNNRRRLNGEETAHRHSLLGKVVLLIGNDTAVLQSLVTQLARKGADIALLCWRIPLEISQQLKEKVQSFGRRLLLVERASDQSDSVEQLIHTVTSEWGHFDIFIDVSTRKNKKSSSQNRVEKTETQPNQLPTKWQLTQKILEEMIHA